MIYELMKVLNRPISSIMFIYLKIDVKVSLSCEHHKETILSFILSRNNSHISICKSGIILINVYGRTCCF